MVLQIQIHTDTSDPYSHLVLVPCLGRSFHCILVSVHSVWCSSPNPPTYIVLQPPRSSKSDLPHFFLVYLSHLTRLILTCQSVVGLTRIRSKTLSLYYILDIPLAGRYRICRQKFLNPKMLGPSVPNWSKDSPDTGSDFHRLGLQTRYFWRRLWAPPLNHPNPSSSGRASGAFATTLCSFATPSSIYSAYTCSFVEGIFVRKHRNCTFGTVTCYIALNVVFWDNQCTGNLHDALQDQMVRPPASFQAATGTYVR